jgi:PAS domain S-box-containing protein
MSTQPTGTPLQGDLQQYRELVASIDGIVWEADARTFQFLFVSQQAERLLGYPLEQWLTPGFWADHLHPEDRDRAMESCLRATREKRSHDLEYRMIAAGGRTVWLRDIVTVIVEGDEATRLRGVMVDYSERKRAEEALRRSEGYLEDAQRLSHVGGWAWSAVTGEFVYWSQEQSRLHGVDPQRGMPSWAEARQFVHPEDRARCLERIDRAIREGTDCEVEYRTVHPDGTIKHVLALGHPVFNASGALVEFVGTEMDVTERKRAEAAVRESEERLRQAVRVSNLGIFDHDHVAETFYWSPEERAIHGWEQERAPNLAEFVAMLHPEDRERISAAIHRAHDPAGDGLFDVEQRIIRPDGEVRWIITRSQTFFEGEGAARHPVRTVGAVYDATEWKRVEERLAEAQEIGGFGSFEVDVTTWVGHCSPALCRILGFETDEPFQDVRAFLHRHVHPDDREMADKARAKLLDEGGSDEIEVRYLRPDGQERILQIRRRALRTAAGGVTKLVGTIQDVTERKRAEEVLRASLREKEVLLKEVHHRVKNNLQLISSLLSLQASQLEDRVAAAAFKEAQNRVRTMAMVHENLYRSGDLASVRLAGHLESLCAHLFRSYNVDPERIVLDLRLEEVTLDLDRSIRLGLLVNELVSNALKYAFPAGRSGRVLVQLDNPSEECYILVVSDNGVGLPPQLAPGDSDSLGLQLIADLTEQLGGSLRLDRDGGTTISIRFPARSREESPV